MHTTRQTSAYLVDIVHALIGRVREAGLNFLEELVAEWYEYQGYFVRRNVLVGKRDAGGWDCELDVVAFDPKTRHLVHVEPTMDALPWAKREERYRRKFDAGREHIPSLFDGLSLPDPDDIEQIVLLGYGTNKNHPRVGGGRVQTVRELLQEILTRLKDTSVGTSAVREDKPILRTLQYVSDNADLLYELATE